MTEWTWLDRAIWTCVALECLLSNPRWCSVMTARGMVDQSDQTENGPVCPACRATFTEERMVEVGMRCPSCGARFFRKPTTKEESNA